MWGLTLVTANGDEFQRVRELDGEDWSVAEQDRGLALLRALCRDADPAWHGYVERSINGRRQSSYSERNSTFSKKALAPPDVPFVFI